MRKVQCVCDVQILLIKLIDYHQKKKSGYNRI